jgi:nitrite reductase/ring-hydroxylating ferredoxin subunit
VTGSVLVEGEARLACPWHGAEFDLGSGASPVEPRWRLRTFEVQVQGDDVGVIA